jgi:hypothetical protein
MTILRTNSSPIDALRALHDQLWDAERGMDRYAPGVAPGIDMGALNLHAVRETALGAFLDLQDGNVERAATALRNVLALQYPLSDKPWGGTFPTSAEQREPPDDAVEWVHYDPNWRQFLGVTLALCSIVHRSVLPDDVIGGIDAALRRCVAGEPDDRIPRWYTNPNLMHAWLQGHVAATAGDVELRAAAHMRLAVPMERLLRYGDLDEYNSPTYDGIDLLAIGLWAMHPPTDGFADAASTMLPVIGARMSTLYHRRFGTSCGPYIRAYGLTPTDYVSLSGLLYAVCGEVVETVLPSPITADTVHVHDLYFLPLLEHLAPVLRPHLSFSAVTSERHHVQRFGTSVAASLLRPELAVGWDSGRRHEASLDQYVPFSAHVARSGADFVAVGVMVPPETAWIDMRRLGDLTFGLRAGARSDRVGIRVVTGSSTILAEDSLTVGPCTITFERPADEVTETTTALGVEVHLAWNTAELTGGIDLRAT